MSCHDNDLVPAGASAAERDRIIKRFRRALDDTVMKVPMYRRVVEPGPVDVLVGASSPDIRLRATINLVGRTRALAEDRRLFATAWARSLMNRYRRPRARPTYGSPTSS